MFLCRTIILLLIVCLLPGVVVAGAGYSGGVEELSPIVVTANRSEQRLVDVAQSVTVIDRADIEAAPATSVAQLLQYASGVDVRQRGGFGVQTDVSIRGGATEQTLVLVNGVSMANPQTGHHNMDIPLDVNNIERIEIIKGPGARVYGANAMAGVINIITRHDQAAAVTLQLKGGEHQYQSSSVQGDFSIGQWHNNLALAQQYSSGFDNDEPTGFNMKTVNYSGRGSVAGNDLEIGAAYGDKKFGASRFYFDSPDQKEETESFVSYAALKLQTGEISWKPQLSWNHHNDIFKYAYGGRWYKNDTDTDKYAAQITAALSGRWGETSFGFSAEREEVDSSNLGNHHRNGYNLFLNHSVEVYDSITFGAGVSAVYYSGWGWEYWPGAEVNYKITEHLQLFASVAKSFRVPTYVEMYYNTPTNIGDADLDAEEAWSYEIGSRWHKKQLSAHLSIFRRESDDLIDWVRGSSSQPWRVRNISSSTTTGVEVGFDIKQPLPVLTQLGRISLDYTYLDHDADSGGLESKYSLDNLRHQLLGAVYFDWCPRLTHVVKVRLQERMLGDSSVVVDSKIMFQLTGNVAVSLEGTNLFDEDYIEAGDASMPGRWIMAGITVQHDFI